MAATHIMVIYEADTGVLRRKVPINADGSITWSNLKPGEDLILLPLSGPTDDQTCYRAIADKIRPARSASISVGL
jgi:hypothetical protein